MSRSFTLFLSLTAGCSRLERVTLQAPPTARVQANIVQLGSLTLVDPYQWMEAPHSPEFKTWASAQDSYARTVLSRLQVRRTVLDRLTALSRSRDEVRNVVSRTRRLFYLKRAADSDVFSLYTRVISEPQEILLFSPSMLFPRSAASIDFFEPSPSGSRVAFGVSEGGSESSTLRVVDVQSGVLLPDSIDRTRHGEPRWRPDDLSFFYRRNPQMGPGAPAADRYLGSRNYLHVLGTAIDSDIAVFGYGLFSDVAVAQSDSTYVYTWPNCHYIIGVVQHGTSNDLNVYFANQTGLSNTKMQWHTLATDKDQVLDLTVHNDDVFLLTHRNAPRSKIVRVNLNLAGPVHFDTIIPASDLVINDLAAAQNDLFVHATLKGSSRLLRIPFGAAQASTLGLPFDGTVTDMAANADLPDVTFKLQSWTRPAEVYSYDPNSNRIAEISALVTRRVTAPQLELEAIELEVKSADGTMIPLSIVYRRGLDRKSERPVLITAYGNYGVSIRAHFDPRRLAWFEQGGIFAVAHVRGGGEDGEEWHRLGQRDKKQNSVDDLVACSRYLSGIGYGSGGRIAVEGISAGAITVGGAITQHPELFSVAIIRVGISDPIRFENTSLGPQNTQEFGSISNESDIIPLFRMSPYYHIAEGTRYPAMLFTAAIHDARVPPWQPAKMVARLQAATSGEGLIILRINDMGHGYGFGTTNDRFNEDLADGYSFALSYFKNNSSHIGIEARSTNDRRDERL
jgi:prolyl oligopeptidase